MEPFEFTPLIIIGAGRSGTNMLRDLLCSMPGFETWPCDEINAIWRHGNLDTFHDEFSDELATPDVKRFIRHQFYKFWLNSGKPEYVVEKTCANSLRPDFVKAVLPEARFIYLVRDGEAVVRSAAKRWRGELEVRSSTYFLSKARYVPFVDLPYYLSRFVGNRWKMISGKSDRISYWGPLFKGIDSLPEDTDLQLLCAMQWAKCIEKCDQSFAGETLEKVYKVYYESIVSDPASATHDLIKWLDESLLDKKMIAKAVSGVRQNESVARYSNVARLSAESRAAILPLLENHGYLESRI